MRYRKEKKINMASGEYMHFVEVRVTGTVPRERHAHSMCIENGNLWVFGGYSDNFSYLNNLYKFNLEKCHWEKTPYKRGVLPIPRHSHSLCYFNGGLYPALLIVDKTNNILTNDSYLFGGISEGKNAPSNLLNDVYRYDIATDNWKELTRQHLPQQPPQQQALQQEELFISGGPAPRWGHTATMAKDGKMVVFGGFGDVVYNDVWILDLVTLKWTQLTVYGTLPRPRQLHSACLYNNELYIVGGYGGRDHLRDFFKLSLDTKEWKQIEATSESTKRRGHTAVVLGDGMYIFGGGKDNATKFNDIYEFDFGTQTWSTVAYEGSGPRPRLFHTSVAYDGCIWVFGGFAAAGANMNDLWCLQLDSSKNTGKVRASKGEGKGLDVLVNNPMFSDVSFNVEGQLFHAHKSILYAKNERFASMLTTSMREANMNVFEIQDIAPHIFLCILKYTDSAEVDPSNAVDILIAADQFLLSGLKKMCASIIIRGLSVDNAVDVLNLADSIIRFHMHELKAKSVETLLKNWDQLTSNDKIRLSDLEEFAHLNINNNNNV